MACEKNEKVKRVVENYEVLTGDEEVKRTKNANKTNSRNNRVE